MEIQSNKVKVHIIANNHIDREWTYDAQLTRMITVNFFEDLIETFETIPDFQFVLDSQTVPLEDFLEIYPEKKEILKRFVKEKRLWIGPWYTAPDSFYLNGESIVRNLLVGHRVAEEFGNVSKFGYTPFGWGQLSQLPQIYAGFGIDSIFFYRGADTIHTNYYNWIGADGTKAYCIKYQRTNFFDKVFRPMTKNRDAVPWDRELDYCSSEIPFMFSSDAFKYEHGFITAGRYVIKEDKIKEATQQFVTKELENFPGNMILAMNGMDTCFPSLKGLLALEKVKNDDDKDYDLIYSSLDQFSVELKEAVNQGQMELQQHKGEMRHFLPGFGGSQKSELKSTHFYLAATRPRQKSKNAKAENLLTRVAEPMAAMSYILGTDYPDKYLALAWKYLLKCHPHDTIAGCGADQIEIDMINRLDQTINISQAVLNFSLQNIIVNIDNSDIRDDEIALVVFNLSPFSRKEVVDLWLHIPEKLGFDDFEILNKQNKKPLKFDIIKRGDQEDRIFRDLTDTTLYIHGELVNVKVEVEISGLGYQTLLVRGTKKANTAASTLVTRELQMENEYVKVIVNKDGSLNIQNKITGKEFNNLHYFTDSGDNGDPWVRFTPDQNRVYTTKGAQATIGLIEDSGLSAAFEIEYDFMIPKGLKKEKYIMEGFFDKAESSSELVPLKVRSVVTLTKSSKYVDIQTEIDNRSTDHLVQVNFPSGLNTSKVYAESGFDVVERNIVRNEKNIDSSLVNGEDPMIRFVDISDDKHGLAILSDSVKGYETLGDSENTIALNLIRAYTSQIVTIYGRKERRPDFELTQAQGIQKFHYGIYLHEGSWENGCLKEAESLNYPLVPTQTHRSFGKLPSEHNFVNISSPKLVLSALKKAEREDAIIVRVYNPSTETVEATLEMLKDIKNAERVNLNEEVLDHINPLGFVGSKLKMDVGAKKIVSYKLEF